MENMRKFAAGLTAAAISASSMSLPALAADDSTLDVVNQITNEESYTKYDSLLRGLYNEQMATLTEVLIELQDFYENVDTNNIIKNAYPQTYAAVYSDLGYMRASYGNGVYSYIPNSADYLTEIINNNQLISLLNIKASGTGRDPEIGLILGEDGKMRSKTAEDQALINQFAQIVQKTSPVNQNLVDLIIAVENDQLDNIDTIFQNTLYTLYQNQAEYIIKTQEKLQDFYENVDTKNIIKDSYPTAYASMQVSLSKEVDLTDPDVINNLMSLLDVNATIFNSWYIKLSNTHGNYDYGLIFPNGERRSMTQEDRQLIDEFTNVVGNMPSLNYSTIDFLNYVNNVVLNTVSKTR